jgi:hypothetical protein
MQQGAPRWWLWGVLLAVGCGGISTQLDSNSDGDEVRDQATGLFLDMTRTDSIDGGEGDNTDWTYLDIIDPGGLRISVGFDNPERLEGAYVSLFDEFGKRLDRRLIVPNTTSYVFDQDVEKVPNKFYIKVFSKDGKSVYSLGARIALAPTAEPRTVVQVQQPEPEPEPEAEVRVRCPKGMVSRKGDCVCPRGTYRAGNRCKRRKSGRVTRPPKNPPVATPSRAPATTASLPPATTGRTIGGQVQRVLPSADGQSVTVFIRLDASGVKKGDRGQLYKNGAIVRGGTVKITKASGKAAKAYVPVASSDVSNGKLTVKIKTR